MTRARIIGERTGEILAGVEGDDPTRVGFEITRYALQYAQDEPIRIEERRGRRWQVMVRMDMTKQKVTP